MILSHTIRLFLDSIGRSEEYEFYFKKFQSASSASFALLCPDYDTLGRARDVFLLQLHYLLRMDLYPTVLLTGPRAAYEARALELAAGPLFRFYRFLYEMPSGGPGQADIVSAGSVEVSRTLRRELERARTGGAIPLALVPAALPDAALSLGAGRILMVRMRGELRTRANGATIAHFLERRPVAVEPEDEPVLDLSRAMLHRRPGLHLAITTPANILKEIFTVKGAGTVVQTGHSIRALSARHQLDERLLVQLIEESFGRRLSGTNFLKEITHYYIEENYQGAVLLAERPDGCYLSKFAVGKGARGAGIAQELWEEVRSRHRTIYWRSRGSNSINRWYARLANGLHKQGDWTVFWVGAPPAGIPDIIAYCTGRPEDLEQES